MGFEPARVDWALKATRGKGLQPAMDHLVEHSEAPVPDNIDDAAEEDEDEGIVPAGSTAASIKCEDCSKLFRSQAYAQFHAEKSGHTNFAESTEVIAPLSEEEKRARLEEMRAKLAEKRKAQSAVDAQESRANELIRRKAGRDAGEIREELKKKEAEKEAQRKKAEKAEELAAKERVRRQIEADKRERAEKARIEKLRREGKLDEANSPGSAAPIASRPLAAAASTAASSSNASEARLRVRLNTGETWMGTLPASATLRELESRIIADGKSAGPKLKLSTTFPRKIYSEEEKGKTLKELGLVPNAALEGMATA